ncbi:hypothetical protein DPMN_072775 [Dreissena polymorpha]|uniref:G-protein coupled receptors family 1 profile domain-containing protein n=1 Tax=Dreissena polymorpha TaxID=45954 RepID=A0A9D4BXW8_DREPO|nr:hypothetical protein DPMN_072775 [Dreissena polymorpha]
MIVTYSLICHQIITRYKFNPLAFTRNDETTYTEDMHLKTFPVTIEGTPCSSLRNRWPLGKHQCVSNSTSHTSLAATKLLSEYSFKAHNSNGSLIGQHPAENTDHIDDGYYIKRNKSNEKRKEEIGNEREHSENLCLLVNENGDDSRSKCNRSSMLVHTQSKECLKSHDRMASIQIRGRCDEQSDLVKYTSLQSLANSSDRALLDFPKENCLNIPSGLTSSTRRRSEEPLKLQKHDVTLKRSNSLTISPFGHIHFNNANTHMSSFSGLRIHRSTQNITPSPRSSVTNRNRVPALSGQHLKITKIMIIVTLVFILSHAPAFVITIWSTVNREFWDNLSVSNTILCEFLLRMYLLNNICNPFIYGFWDRRFNREVKITFQKLYNSILEKCRKNK